jgi:hypothetical protein
MKLKLRKASIRNLCVGGWLLEQRIKSINLAELMQQFIEWRHQMRQTI